MKKSLIVTLALVFVLGLAGTAFANPYSDVPAGHWAYKAVMDLQKVGIMEGAGGKFMGNATLTRYEAAAITARAMAKADKADAATKATIDKLAVEFSKELNDLGVKVAKIEKQLGAWKFGGDARIRYQVNADLKATDTNGVNSTKRFQERVRFSAQSDVNENTVVNFRIAQQNTWALKTNGGTSTSANGSFEMDIAKFTFKNLIGTADVVFGRDAIWLGSAGLMADSAGIDGVRIQDKTKDFKWTVGAYNGGNGNPLGESANSTTTGAAGQTKAFWFAEGSYPVLPNTVMTAGYLKGISNVYLLDNYYVGAKITAGDFTINGDYTKNNEDKAAGDKKGLLTSVWYKGANMAQPGTWGVYVDYRKVGGASFDSGLTTMNASNNTTGVKGMGFGGNYTFAKNAKFTLAVESLSNYADTVDYKTMTYAYVNFAF